MCLMSPRTFTISSSIQLSVISFYPTGQTALLLGNSLGQVNFWSLSLCTLVCGLALGWGAQLRPMFFGHTPDSVVSTWCL